MHHGRARVQPPQLAEERRHGRVADETGAEIRRDGAAQPEDIFPKPIDPDRQRKREGFLPVDLPPEDPRRVVERPEPARVEDVDGGAIITPASARGAPWHGCEAVEIAPRFFVVAAAAAFTPKFMERVRPGVSAARADYEATFFARHRRQEERYVGQLHALWGQAVHASKYKLCRL